MLSVVYKNDSLGLGFNVIKANIYLLQNFISFPWN